MKHILDDYGQFDGRNDMALRIVQVCENGGDAFTRLRLRADRDTGNIDIYIEFSCLFMPLDSDLSNDVELIQDSMWGKFVGMYTSAATMFGFFSPEIKCFYDAFIVKLRGIRPIGWKVDGDTYLVRMMDSMGIDWRSMPEPTPELIARTNGYNLLNADPRSNLPIEFSI